MFNTDRASISKHVKNIIESEELDKSNVQKLHIPFSDKPVNVYNLNFIISIGFRVNSKRATSFRIWSNKILKQYLTKGYALDESRILKYKDNLIELSNNVIKLENKISNVEVKVKENKKEINYLKGIIKKVNNKVILM